MGKDVLSYNKLVARTRYLVRRYWVPLHGSRTKNEKFSVHTICVLFVLFQIEQKDYRLFVGWLEIAPALGLKNVPHWTTLQKAFARLPPRLLRKLVQLAGRCTDRIAALDRRTISSAIRVMATAGALAVTCAQASFARFLSWSRRDRRKCWTCTSGRRNGMAQRTFRNCNE